MAEGVIARGERRMEGSMSLASRARWPARAIACAFLALVAPVCVFPGAATIAAAERPAQASSSRDARQAVVRGRTLLSRYQCGSCHEIPGVPAARGVLGPPLVAFGRRMYVAGHLPNTPDTLAQWIADPRSLVPDTAMPSMGASREEAADMAAYLASLR
jgi:cytochrome c1